MSMHQSDSTEQQEAEGLILTILQDKIGCSFKHNAHLPININVKLDAIDPEKKIVVEVYARIGK